MAARRGDVCGVVGGEAMLGDYLNGPANQIGIDGNQAGRSARKSSDTGQWRHWRCFRAPITLATS